jgi:hypothetical protein
MLVTDLEKNCVPSRLLFGDLEENVTMDRSHGGITILESVGFAKEKVELIVRDAWEKAGSMKGHASRRLHQR